MTFDCVMPSFENKPVVQHHWQTIAKYIIGNSNEQKKKWQRLLLDRKYLKFDRGLERLKEKLKVVDPNSKAEQEKQEIFKQIGYTSFRASGEPFKVINLTADEYSRLVAGQQKNNWSVRTQKTTITDKKSIPTMIFSDFISTSLKSKSVKIKNGTQQDV